VLLHKAHVASGVPGTIVRYVSLAGYGNDPRLEPMIERLVHDSKKYDAACWINGDQPCAWGYARLVWGLAALPDESQTREVSHALRRGIEFLLSHRSEHREYP